MSMFPIATQTLASATNGITFNNVPQTFTHLQLRVFQVTTVAGTNTSFGIQFATGVVLLILALTMLFTG